MKNVIISFLFVFAALPIFAQKQDKEMDRFISSLMKKMTLEEKIGQTILSGGNIPGYNGRPVNRDDAIRQGLLGTTSIGDNFDESLRVQKIAAEESRLKIPLLLGLDVIHGLHTIFPIPLASSTSWNLPLIERSARIAADEATAYGINWTWSPMVDIARDCRWGRIAEGAGEDPYLGGQIAAAMVHGYQGKDLSADTTLLCCVKHFALYGGAEGGRDYNTVDMSRVTMYNYYLPPYKAAVDAGVGSVMSSFNVVDGVPATGNKWLLTNLLRSQWGFKGFVVSDANSICEMSIHGLGDNEDVSVLAMKAGLDMDLGGGGYANTLKKALQEKRVTMSEIDQACRRVLEAKYRLGLFKDPYTYTKNKNRQKDVLSPAHLSIAQQLADESIVLLKNTEHVLPLRPQGNVVVVGPMGNSRSELIGTWANSSFIDPSRSVYEAVKETVGENGQVVYTQGCNFTEEYSIKNGQFSVPTDSLLKGALKAACQADVIIAAVGEPSGWTGEASSRQNPSLPECQKRMLKALKATGKPVVVVILAGRPLVLTEEDAEFSTLVEGWHGGTMAGQAMSDVLFGKVNPSAKLTTTFPRYVGQIPIYYNHLNTGRPSGDFWATSKYFDGENTPLYPFGYGLSYTTFDYGKPTLSKSELNGENDSLTLTVPITNTGNREGKEIVQLYVRDVAASISRPVKELKGFQKIYLAKGETKDVRFTIGAPMLKFYNSELKYVVEPGEFELMVGANSRDVQTLKIQYK
ncbi:MAG: beta-glucosidase BglX [Bacteroidaceae bacterium]|nr:beta-glucosidase BglX [Bacteroidaceae bacterium]